jgi:hypothetical protein
LIWTALWASIGAQAFKAKAFWFCLVLAIIALGGAYLYQTGKSKVAKIISLIASTFALAYYLQTFIASPEEDANFRIGLIILSSIALLIVTLMPTANSRDS